MPSTHLTPRTHLLDTTFWEILPSHYNKIIKRWTKIAHLYNEAKFNLIASDRAGALNSLRAELEMLDHDIREYRDLVKTFNVTDVAEIYVVAGRARHRALQIAKENFENLEMSLKMVEEKITDVKADIRYGLLKTQ